jgi:hypothetical protein
MKLSKKQLIKSKWRFYRRIGKNCEIWKKGEKMILWNRKTLKVYLI